MGLACPALIYEREDEKVHNLYIQNMLYIY